MSEALNSDLSPTCQSYGLCESVIDLLIDIGVEKDRIDPCDGSGEFPCSRIPNNIKILFDTLGPESAQRILDFVEKFFDGNEDQLHDSRISISQNPPFRCPEIGIDVYHPCSVTSCAFYTTHPWARNCILYYMVRQERKNLTNNDLAFLLGSSPSSLRVSLVKAMQRIRKGALKEEILKEPSMSMVTRLSSPNVCAVCESKIEEGKSYSSKDGLFYCSRNCYLIKPPTVIRIESEFSLSIKRILGLCAERFAVVSLMANAVGVTQSVFRDLCGKYVVSLPE